MVTSLWQVDLDGLTVDQGDGGDSCYRNYTAHLRSYILGLISLSDTATQSDYSIVADPDKTQELLEVEPGIYVRNPFSNYMIPSQPTQWYNDPATTSRDQLTPVICFHALRSFHGDKSSASSLWRLFKACFKRGMFAQNTKNNFGVPGTKIPDWITPDLWSIFLRGLGKWSYILYPLIALLDSVMLIGALIYMFAPIISWNGVSLKISGSLSSDPTSTDDGNMNNIINAAQYTFDTPLSWLTRKIYLRYRPKNNGNYIGGETSAIMGAISWYDQLPGGCPGMVNMMRPIVDRY